MNKILADLEFNTVINEAHAQTQTGGELLNKYKSFIMNHEITYDLVNSFVKEAQLCRYDNGINQVLESVADYINCNKTSWALATVCESINHSNASYNYLNKNAVKHVEKLLEMQEEDIVKYIKAGALKNVMYCEGFRNIAKQVYKNQPVVEASADYLKATPVSMIENVGDGFCFEVAGTLYKLDDDKNIQECQWNEVSNTFKTVSSLLESSICEVNSETIIIKAPNATYEIPEANNITKHGKEGDIKMTLEQLRDNNRLILSATNPRHRNNLAGVLEAIALTCENYDKILSMDNTTIYSTKNDKFVVIESGDNLYATLLQSNRHPKWTINEDAISALSFIKSKTNVSLDENYADIVSNVLENTSIDEQEKLEEEFKNNKINSYKERIEALTEKFKNDPVKLAVLSKLAKDVAQA